MNHLNKIFKTKGLKFKRVIITDLKLPSEIANPLDRKAQFKAKNELEREKHVFDLRVLNDEEEIELLR